MELPENKVEHWKAKFIDGLPPLFAERVRKALRGSHGEIPYKDCTYGKLIGTCTQEGLNLCNELHMSRQLKMDKLKERSQLGDFCTLFGLPDSYAKSSNKSGSKDEHEARKSSRRSHTFTNDRLRRDLSKVKCYKCGQLGHITPNCRLNELKTLELDEETYDKVYGLLYTLGSEDDYYFEYGSDIELLDASNNDKNCDNPCTTCKGDTCTCEEDEIYKLQSQFQDFNMNIITSDNVIEILKEVNDNQLREKIINLATSNEATPYSLKVVDDRLIKKNAFPERDSSFDDLKNENKLYPSIILGTPFINAIYPFTGINSKGFSATYKNNEISYCFVTDPETRDINALIDMKQNHKDSSQLELFSMIIFDSLKSAKVKEKINLISEQNCHCYICKMDPPWIHAKGRGKVRSSQGPSYGSTSNLQSYQGSSYRS
ncbi:hypothetical protein H5410_004745 [Solanum commersonii]|uniref:CCHC-type domain-containing protein n=1 Tax=Solanum commersonii TaxID=4109 RepID=A0A9J6A632_SOLCO|nr:hypothetical protein H5410_004745 [Solanum commersonii]